MLQSSLLVSALFCGGCAHGSNNNLSHAIPSPPPGLAEIQRRCWGAGSDGVRLWRCLTRNERRGMTAGVIVLQQRYHPKDLHVIRFDRNHDPIEVTDLRSGFRGIVDYDGTVVVSTDNENGWRLVPLSGSDDHWAILVWKMQGEFDIYRRLRQL